MKVQQTMLDASLTLQHASSQHLCPEFPRFCNKNMGCGKAGNEATWFVCVQHLRRGEANSTADSNTSLTYTSCS